MSTFFTSLLLLLYRKSIGGQALQASASSNFRSAAHQHGHPGGHPLHGHHQPHLSSSNNHHHNTQNTHQTHDQNTEEEGVDVVGLDSSDSAYSHHSKFFFFTLGYDKKIEKVEK